MKIYKVISGQYQMEGSSRTYGDEWVSYLGVDFSAAKRALIEESSTTKNNEKYYTEGRIFEIDDDVDVDDKDELTNALCDCCGFDTFYSDFAITEKG